MAGWSLLPPDLVHRIGDRLLTSSDLDYYVDMRGVCRQWRSATADPHGRADCRFEQEHWVILDLEPPEEDGNDDGNRLFLNLLTGRFLRRRLPLLRVHDLVSFRSGYLILRDRKHKDIFYYINQLTGYMLPPAAKPEPPQVRAALADSPNNCDGNEFPVVCASGEVLLIRRLHSAFEVFRKKGDGKLMEPVESIGCLAIFLGAERCLSVDADKLPTVDRECIYYIGSLDGEIYDDGYLYEECANMYKYDLSNGCEEKISSRVADYFDRLYVRRPFTLAQLLLAYCAWSFRH